MTSSHHLNFFLISCIVMYIYPFSVTAYQCGGVLEPIQAFLGQRRSTPWLNCQSIAGPTQRVTIVPPVFFHVLLLYGGKNVQDCVCHPKMSLLPG